MHNLEVVSLINFQANLFDELISKAKANASSKKVSKSEAENTALPGYYNLHNNHIHFKLHKALTGPSTSDIKGYALSEEFIAIIPSKHCKLSFQDVIFSNPETQKLYNMTNNVYQRDSVNVYKISEISLNDVISELEIDLDFNFNNNSDTVELQGNGGINVEWDKDQDKPKAHLIGDSFDYGAGAKLEASVKAKFSLPSLFGPILTLDFLIFGEIGAFFHIDEGFVQFPEILLGNKSITLKEFDFSFDHFWMQICIFQWNLNITKVTRLGQENRY